MAKDSNITRLRTYRYGKATTNRDNCPKRFFPWLLLRGAIENTPLPFSKKTGTG
jgi:hypothetical protein